MTTIADPSFIPVSNVVTLADGSKIAVCLRTGMLKGLYIGQAVGTGWAGNPKLPNGGQVFNYADENQLWNDKLAPLGNTWRKILGGLGYMLNQLLKQGYPDSGSPSNPAPSLNLDAVITDAITADMQFQTALGFIKLAIDGNGNPRVQPIA